MSLACTTHYSGALGCKAGNAVDGKASGIYHINCRLMSVSTVEDSPSIRWGGQRCLLCPVFDVTKKTQGSCYTHTHWMEREACIRWLDGWL